MGKHPNVFKWTMVVNLFAPATQSKALDLWTYDNGVLLDFSRPGKPTDNPFIESFNGSFRNECLNAVSLIIFALWKMERLPQ